MDTLTEKATAKRPIRTLVVDDEEAICQLIANSLCAAGMQAETLTNSRVAAVRLAEETFDAVFLDYRMPPPDGEELARQLRLSRRNQNALVVLITGEEDPGLMNRLFEAGADFVLFKPLDPKRMMRLINAVEGPARRERRRNQRVAVECNAVVETARGPISGKVLDLSLCGAMIQAERAVPEGSQVGLSVWLHPDSPPMHTPAGVVYADDQGRVGVEFIGMADAVREELQEFLLPKILALVNEAKEKDRQLSKAPR